MSSWEQMIASRARHGSFTGRGLANETEYYEFFECRTLQLDEVTHKIASIYSRSLSMMKSPNVTFRIPANNLFGKWV